MTTYEILEELRKINDMRNAFDEETGVFLYSDEEIENKINSINAEKKDKLNAIEDFKRKLKKDVEFYEEKKNKQESNIKKANKDIEYLKELQCDLLGGKKLKTDEYNFYYTTSKSVNITDEKRVLEHGLFTKVTKTADKTAIKKAIQEGQKVLGAEIVTKKSLVIK